MSLCQETTEPTHSPCSAASAAQVLEMIHKNGRTILALGVLLLEAGGVENFCLIFPHSPENDLQLNHTSHYYFHLLHALHRINIIM